MTTKALVKKRETGIALIVVMLIVALVTIVAVQMMERLQLNVARTGNVKANNQAFWYALSAEQYAQQQLQTLSSQSKDNINLSQPWAQVFEYPVEGGSIKAELIDMQTCFNLNAISATAPPSGSENSDSSGGTSGNNNTKQNQTSLAFERLLENYMQDSLARDTLRDSLIDWIDADEVMSDYGAEDSIYESLPLPYLAANSRLSHISELRLINGIEPFIQQQVIQDLLKVVCVLPESTLKLNVNTINEESAVVLSALLGQTSTLGNNIISSRPLDGFKEKNDFLALPEITALKLTKEQQDWFDVTTQYFKLKTTAKYQDAQFRLSTVFKLENDKVTIVSREFGGVL